MLMGPRSVVHPWTRSRRPGLTVAVSLLPLLTVACGQEASEGTSSPDTTSVAESTEVGSTTRSLKVIMEGLAADMAGVAMGIWMEDAPLIAEGSQRIAEHPSVPPEQMIAIQGELGEEFTEFVAFDRLVHDLAVELRDAAHASRPPPELVETFGQIAEGCVACHAAFKERVTATLVPLSDGK